MRVGPGSCPFERPFAPLDVFIHLYLLAPRRRAGSKRIFPEARVGCPGVPGEGTGTQPGLEDGGHELFGEPEKQVRKGRRRGGEGEERGGGPREPRLLSMEWGGKCAPSS